MQDKQKEAEKSSNELHLRVNDVPGLPSIFLFGFQQTMLCLSGMLVIPFIVAEIACAGAQTTELRVQLIAATFVTCGIATLVQTTFGLRLSILHGPSFAFLPPLLAFKALPENECQYGEHDNSPEDEWRARIATIQGSLLIGVVPMVILGATGLVGKFAKFVGPVTICPLLILLTLGSVPTLKDKLEMHWISIFELGLLLILVIFLEEVHVPIPYYSFKQRKLSVVRVRIFGQFPYLIGIGVAWLVCGLLTITDWEKEGGNARLDKNVSVAVLRESPWFQVPLPGAFGLPKISLGLFLGFLASAMACTMESIGDYSMCARISCEPHPPSSSVNRAILCEGFGALLAAIMGVGTGVTTYAENIALMHVTKVASRITMQCAGCLLIIIGLFTKTAAVMATLPEAIVGGVLGMGMTMICGVALSNLHSVDLHLSRNLSIMGAAILLGNVIPEHFMQHPVETGHKEVDNMFNMLLTIKMLIGGLIAFTLDNLVRGATPSQRGFPEPDTLDELSILKSNDDGYALPNWMIRVLLRFPILTKLPFMPSLARISSASSESAESTDDTSSA